MSMLQTLSSFPEFLQRIPTVGECEQMAELFAAAIGVFKNPLFHRVVGNKDFAQAIEELMHISRLLPFIKTSQP